jgi:hypothetical protein
MSLIAGNLGIMQRLLDQHEVVWGIFGGAAAHLYGNRRPIKNIDILVMSGSLRDVVQMMQQAKRVGQFDGRRIMWSGINLCDDLTVKRDGSNYPLKMDQPMIDHVRNMPLLGSPVKLLAPEDVLIHKLLLNRGSEQGKFDFEDAQGIALRQKLDTAYLKQRLQLCNALSLLQPKLEELGTTLPA